MNIPIHIPSKYSISSKMILFGGALFFITFFCGVLFSFSENTKEDVVEAKKKQMETIEAEYEAYVERVEKRYSSEIDEKKEELQDLRGNLNDKLLKFDENKKISTESEMKIVETAKIAQSLKEELDILKEEIEMREQRLAIMLSQIDEKELQIRVLTEEQSKLTEEKDFQQVLILDFFKTIQTEDEEFATPKELQTMAKIIFTDESVSDQIREMDALNAVEKNSRELFYAFDTASSRVAEASKIFEKENTRLLKLKEKFLGELDDLNAKKEAQQTLLDEAKMTEEKYQKLWAESLEQMNSVISDIREIKNLSEKMNNDLKNLERQKRFEKQIVTKDKLKEKVLESVDAKNLSLEELGKLFAFENDILAPLSWPVVPKNGISAYFHDESYKKRFGIGHEAIDLPIPQGTPVKSAGAGYIYKAVDNGLGYSYIIVLHKDNVRTVYGHISDILVKEGQLVQEGDVIGKSGGQPGTKGAGRLTTGPHLHFEVLEGDVHKNPLEYLPLSELKKAMNEVEEE